MTSTEIVRRAKKGGVQLVRFLYCDNGGTIRGKTTHVDHLAERMEQGIGLVMGMMSMTGMDFLAPDASFGPVGEVRLVPDPDTFTLLPYAPRSAQMICDMLTLERKPWALDPRSFLKRMIAKAEARGLYLDAVFENEFYLARTTENGFESLDRSLCFSGIGMDSAEDVIQDIVAALTAQGIIVEQYMPELGPGQQELSIRHAPALRAADNQITFRQTVRAVAARHGLVGSLAPKPFANEAGNGAHIHWSAWNKGHTKNLFVDKRDANGLSPLAYQFIAGVLHHLPALLALTTPTVNSFRRLQPHFWSSAYTAWGIENREAAVRVPTRYWGNESGSTNMELKASDPSNNPYLALGALIAAGLDGVEKEMQPGPSIDRDPGNWTEEERTARGIERYPTTLDTALDALERDEVLQNALGAPLAQEYIRVKRAEAEHFRGKGDEYELEQHRFKY
ncbi:MAG TPA: glutamine synthetase family protein [Anaerolineae bacterium]|nr:glutamine synthetase family protein [Anaerolineae bacterium]